MIFITDFNYVPWEASPFPGEQVKSTNLLFVRAEEYINRSDYSPYEEFPVKACSNIGTKEELFIDDGSLYVLL